MPEVKESHTSSAVELSEEEPGPVVGADKLSSVREDLEMNMVAGAPPRWAGLVGRAGGVDGDPGFGCAPMKMHE